MGKGPRFISFLAEHKPCGNKNNDKVTAAFQDIIDVKNDRDILILSHHEGSEVVGVFDPNMVMAFENTYDLLGFTRYFSHQDYINRTKTGMVILRELTPDLDDWK